MQLTQLTEHIWSFPVPYKDIFVQLYILQTEKGTVLFDTAACQADVDAYIVPALTQLGLTPSYIFISHNHADHAGGISFAAARYPKAQIVSCCPTLGARYPGTLCPEDGELLLDVLQVVTVPGHTPDSAALLDLRTNTLISGDALQSYGIFGSGYWYCNVRFPVSHKQAVEKLRRLPIRRIATAHDYHPDGVVSSGSEQVSRRLDACLNALNLLRDRILAHPELNDEALSALCNDGALPRVSVSVLAAVRQAVTEGLF